MEEKLSGRSDRATLNAEVTNAVSGGALNLSDSSTIQIGATNALTNAATVSFNDKNGSMGGSLVLNGYSTTIGSITSTVVGSGLIVNNGYSDAVLTIGGSLNSSFSGVIADASDGSVGSLGVSKTGTGMLVLSGTNTYTGGTSVLAGTLQGTSNGLQGNILNEATVIYDQDFDGTYAGVMAGTGTLTKNGTGKLSLTAVQTFTGATDINAGNLNVNGSLASSSIVNVNAGGTLSGSGQLGKVNVNGGIVSPGNSVGTLHIDGDYTMWPASTYYVELNGERSDLIVVSRAATIQSSIFEIGHDTNTASAPVLPGKTYTLITTQNGLSVTSPEVEVADFPFISFTLSADAFNGYLTTSRSAEQFSDFAGTANEKAVANALDAAGPNSPLWQQVVGASEAQARAAFSNLSNASIHANAVGVLSAQSQYLRDAITDRLRQGFFSGPTMPATDNVLSFGPETKTGPAEVNNTPFNKAQPAGNAAPVYAMWAEGLGSWGALPGNSNAARTDYSLGGVISGFDVTFDHQWRIGMAAGYSETNFDSPDAASSGSSGNYHAALYGGGQSGDWGLRAGASLSWNDISTQRSVLVANLSDVSSGEDEAWTTQLFGEVGHRFTVDLIVMEPFANIAYVRVDSSVSDIGIAGVSGDARIDTTYTTLGMRGVATLSRGWSLRGMLGWRHAFGDVVPQAILAFISGGPEFSLAGSPIARDALVAQAGLDLTIAPDILLGVSWSGQFGDEAYDNAVKANFTWRF